MQVPLEDAYAEACKALGEAHVRERLLLAEVGRLTDELRRTSQQAEPEVVSPGGVDDSDRQRGDILLCGQD